MCPPPLLNALLRAARNLTNLRHQDPLQHFATMVWRRSCYEIIGRSAMGDAQGARLRQPRVAQGGKARHEHIASSHHTITSGRARSIRDDSNQSRTRRL
jgi:hypothetical protein